MSHLFRFATLALVPALLAGGAALAVSPTPVPAASAAVVADGTRCEIRVYRRGGETMVEGVMFAAAPIRGSFRLSVDSAGIGGTDHDQSGGFVASPNGATSLGQLVVRNGSYAAQMTVRWKGGETTCAQHVG